MSSGTPAMAALATMASVAVIGMHGAQAGQAADVARAGFVVDDARRHEQRGLEGRVVHDVKHGGHGGQRAVQARAAA